MPKVIEECHDPCKFVGHFGPMNASPNACSPPVVGDANKCDEVIQSRPKVKFSVPNESGDQEGFLNDLQAAGVQSQTPTERTPELTAQFNEENFQVSEYKRADESNNPPCYMPQPGDDLPTTDQLKSMGPIGPWATGKVDWSPLSGLTGTRPVVDRYSITRFSTNEWRTRNKELLNKAFDVFELGYRNANNAKNTMLQNCAALDKTQGESTKRVTERAQLVNKWKLTLERAIKAMSDEISTLEEQRFRLKSSASILKTPQSIASECLDLRSTRPQNELIRDKPEEELVNELALIGEIETVFNKTLAEIVQQQIENRAARNRLEYDWSDKKDAYEIETINAKLNNLSTITLFRPGATRFPDEQSSEEYWLHFSSTTLEECENCRQKSVALRGTLDAILLNGARDLRSQADTVEKAFAVRIGCMVETVNRLENELKTCLHNIAENEILIEKMKSGMKGLDNVMKVAQTRLDNRNHRPHVENCRDQAQVSLVDEVKLVQDCVSSSVLQQIQNVNTKLIQTRSNLEQEIMVKRLTLKIDRERCMLLRSQFPSANQLSG